MNESEDFKNGMRFGEKKMLLKIKSDIGNFSDGYHTFNQLYYQRTMLFAVIVNLNKDISWKTRKHEDGELCFGGGWFLVTVDTPDGAYGYHCEDKYWDLFECEELEKAKHFDGYTEDDVDRLFSLFNNSRSTEKIKRIDIDNPKTPRKVKCVNIDTHDMKMHSENNHLLKLGETYTMTDIIVHNWFTAIRLKEFNVPFNSVDFCEVE